MKKKDPLAVALGSRGGRKTAKRGKAYYKRIGAIGDAAQGKKKPLDYVRSPSEIPILNAL
jgi:hypothetical protein